jgi:hypothetical protein
MGKYATVVVLLVGLSNSTFARDDGRYANDPLKHWFRSGEGLGHRTIVNLIENNVGKDLQYIRFNGALIGGLAGLFLYSAEALLRSAEAFLRLA